MSHMSPGEKNGLQGAALRGMREQNLLDRQQLAAAKIQAIQERATNARRNLPYLPAVARDLARPLVDDLDMLLDLLP